MNGERDRFGRLRELAEAAALFTRKLDGEPSAVVAASHRSALDKLEAEELRLRSVGATARQIDSVIAAVDQGFIGMPDYRAGDRARLRKG